MKHLVQTYATCGESIRLKHMHVTKRTLLEIQAIINN